ncbi:MAG: TetR/AcrR family transcriptional regulator [Planctomycetes bacterium]|nr:TetR/AcrR family transcriptional regulator [Planctomycetota bacterium]
MATLDQKITRKERERQEREEKILELARTMLREVGYLGLSMDRIAAEMEYSKGTIYQHFCNKEEIILALANEALEKRLEMFEAAATWSGAETSRDRMAAIGAAAEEFVERYPQHFSVEQIVRSSSIWEKTSEERRQFMQVCEGRCMAIVSGVVREALAQGDLELPAGRSVEDLVFGLWSLNFGAYTIITSSEALEEIGIADPIAALRQSQNFMLDGYRWRPLSSEHDFNETFDQVKREVFGNG